MAEHVLPLSRLANLLEIVVALVGENVFAQFKHKSPFQARRSAPPRGGGENGVDDRLIAGAPADVAGNRLDHFDAAGIGVAIDERLRGHEHSRRAISALGGEIIHERRLKRMKLRAGLETIRGLD